MNVQVLIGRIGQDAVERTTQNGKKIVTWSMATKEGYKDKDGNWVDVTEWHRCVAFGGLAGVAGAYVVKGMMLGVIGKKRTREYESEGIKKQIIETVVDKIEFVEGKKKAETEEPVNTEQEEGLPF